MKNKKKYLWIFTILLLVIFIQNVNAEYPSITLYRCYATNQGFADHALSTDPNCEGMPGRDGAFIKVSATPLSDMVALYRCHQRVGTEGDTFSTTSSTCEGTITWDNMPQPALTFGYVRTSSAPGFVPVYRCGTKPGQNFDSTDPNCEGQPHNMGVIYYAVYPGATAPAISVSVNSNVATGQAPLSVQFTSAVSGGSGSYSSYSWSFSDGTTASGASVSKTFSTAGTFTAALTVTDSFGNSASQQAVINIGNATNKQIKHNLDITSAMFEKEKVKPNEYAELYVRVLNNGNVGEENINVIVFIHI